MQNQPIVSREKEKKRGLFTTIAEGLMPRFPDLKEKLRLADMKESQIEFLERVVATTTYISFGIILVYFLLLKDIIASNSANNIILAVVMIISPIALVPLVVFNYFMLYPLLLITRRKKEIDYEVLFAGRHIEIALKSGMPLFDTFLGATTGYGAVSKEIAKIVDRVVLGIPMIQAIRDVTADSPSLYLTRMMMQIANSISSGADVGKSLESVLDQMSKEQMIGLKEYSQKLTPLIMFYMVFGIVVPSLGIVLMTVIMSSISGGRLGIAPFTLVGVGIAIFLVQILFMGFIESSRPKYLI